MVPVPWSVPSVPLMRAVRPNSVATTTTVSRQRAPSPLSNSASAPSRPPSNCASRPVAPPSLAWVSQPSKASAAMRGPSSAAISLAAPRATSRIAAGAIDAGLRLHVVALRGLVELQAGGERLGRAPDRAGCRDRSAASRCRRRPAAASTGAHADRRRAHRAGSAAWSGRPRAAVATRSTARQRFAARD